MRIITKLSTASEAVDIESSRVKIEINGDWYDIIHDTRENSLLINKSSDDLSSSIIIHPHTSNEISIK